MLARWFVRSFLAPQSCDFVTSKKVKWSVRKRNLAPDIQELGGTIIKALVCSYEHKQLHRTSKKATWTAMDKDKTKTTPQSCLNADKKTLTLSKPQK